MFRPVVGLLFLTGLLGTGSPPTRGGVAAQEAVSGTYECSVRATAAAGELQMSCVKLDTPGPTGNNHYEIADVRWYKPSPPYIADWLKFKWRSSAEASMFRLSVKFQQGAYFTECSEFFFDATPGAQQEKTSIPHACGSDEPWTAVTIEPADDHDCMGCGTFQRSALPESRTLAPESADPAEVNILIQEFTHRAQMGAARQR